ncbi:hypothetical protein E5358_12180 [Palleniella muris]|uniref:Uncharacterized protein n=1 Tax=Palleniella muris TaxID=3038145 RepID=A0AC61QMZ6_9BACT|nr:hypothetical protein E5358_12180 [Palleniella muris]
MLRDTKNSRVVHIQKSTILLSDRLRFSAYHHLCQRVCGQHIEMLLTHLLSCHYSIPNGQQLLLGNQVTTFLNNYTPCDIS